MFCFVLFVLKLTGFRISITVYENPKAKFARAVYELCTPEYHMIILVLVYISECINLNRFEFKGPPASVNLQNEMQTWAMGTTRKMITKIVEAKVLVVKRDTFFYEQRGPLVAHLSSRTTKYFVKL